MAVTFNLSDGTTTIDFTSATDFVLKSQLGEGFLPKVAVPTGDNSIPDYITEVVPVFIRCTSHNDMATTLQEFHSLQRRAAEYWVDEQQTTPVWWNIKTDDETGARRALVKSLGLDFAPEWGGIYNDCPDLDAGRPANVVIVRHPYWERSATRTFPNTTPSAAAAVSYNYTSTADPVGDVPARVNALSVRQGAGAVALHEVWMGIRSASKHGATGVTSFVPVWESESGSNNADASISDDGGGSEPNTASPGGGSGDYVNVDPEAGGAVIDWDDGSFNLVYYQTLAQAGYATASNAYGLFLFLLRAKTTAGTYDVRLQAGYSYPEQDYGEIVEVGGAWNYYEMLPLINIPLRNAQAIDTTQFSVARDMSFTVRVLARRTSGAGDLLLDCLCPIPVDEGFLHIDGAYMTSTYDVVYGQGPTDRDQALSTTTTVYRSAPYDAQTFRLPPGDGRIIAVYKREAGCIFTDQIEFADSTNVTNSYTERWVSLRGSE